MKRKIEVSSWEENIETYKGEFDWTAFLVGTFIILTATWLIIDQVVGADKFISWVAGMIT
jgi:hypothetical protein